jgi:hypothetical protein
LVEKALNDLSKKLWGEEGEAMARQRLIHDAATSGLEANLLCHKRKGPMVWENA